MEFGKTSIVKVFIEFKTIEEFIPMQLEMNINNAIQFQYGDPLWDVNTKVYRSYFFADMENDLRRSMSNFIVNKENATPDMGDLQ